MNDDSMLRAALIVVMLILLPIGLYHRRVSQSSGERLDRRQEGLFILATLRPLEAAFWFGVFAWMINPRWEGLVFVRASALGQVDKYRRPSDYAGAFRRELSTVHGTYGTVRPTRKDAIGMKFLPCFMIAAMLVPGVIHAEPAAEPMARTEKLFIRRSFLVGDSRPAFPAAQVARQRSTGRKVLGGVVGAVGGFFGGGYLGSKLEPDCNCDDPGVIGFLIGAPIGAVVGGILGAKFF